MRDLLKRSSYILTGPSQKRTCLGWLKAHRRLLTFILFPLICLPLPLLVSGQEALAGYILLLTVCYWITDTLSLQVTGLVPAVLVALLGIAPYSEMLSGYFTAGVVMVLAVMVMAQAVSETGLDKRVALAILSLSGNSPTGVMACFMVTSFILSMVIANVAVIGMLLAFLEAILLEFEGPMQKENSQIQHMPISSKNGRGLTNYRQETDMPIEDKSSLTKCSTIKNLENKTEDEANVEPKDEECNQETDNDHNETQAPETNEPVLSRKEITQMGKCLTLSICFAGQVGGNGTLIGSVPNIRLKEEADKLWQANGMVESPVTFVSWMAFCLPMAALSAAIIFVWLRFYFYGFKRSKNNAAKNAGLMRFVKRKKDELPPLRFCEWVVIVVFAILLLLLFFRSPGFMQGWSVIFQQGYSSDAMVSLTLMCVLLVIPKELPSSKVIFRTKDDGSIQMPPTILSWGSAKKVPWGIVFLVGGSGSLGAAANRTGLSSSLGRALTNLTSLPPPLIVFIVTLAVALLTEVLGALAILAILLPLMAQLTDTIGYNPLYLMFPATLGSVFSFMLPISSPAIFLAFTYNRINAFDLLKAGALMNIICVLITLLATHTWGWNLFDLGTHPWPDVDNSTASIASQTDLLPIVM